MEARRWRLAANLAAARQVLAETAKTVVLLRTSAQVLRQQNGERRAQGGKRNRRPPRPAAIRLEPPEESIAIIGPTMRAAK